MSGSTIAVEACGLVVLASFRDVTCWQFANPASREAVAPSAAPSAADADAARPIVERVAARAFGASGGASAECLAELLPWKAVFVRRRLTHAKTMFQSALDGTLSAPSADSLQRARKKDLPDPSDKVGIRRLLTSHSLQETIVKQRAGSNRRRRLIAAASRAVDGGRLVWSAPQAPVLAMEQRRASERSGADFEALDRPVCSRHRRVLVDGLATPRECALLIGAAVVGMDGDDEGAASGESVVVTRAAARMPASGAVGSCRMPAGGAVGSCERLTPVNGPWVPRVGSAGVRHRACACADMCAPGRLCAGRQPAVAAARGPGRRGEPPRGAALLEGAPGVHVSCPCV